MYRYEEYMELFLPYAIYDDIGDLVGIKDDAPEDAKKAYEEFNDMIKKAEEAGVKI